MLWDIRARMKPALAIIDMIPNVHRTLALNTLRRAVYEGRPRLRNLPPEDKDFAFYDAPVQLSSPIGARLLKELYYGGHIKLKKPVQKSLPTLDAYIATEPAFRAEVARIEAEEQAWHDRLAVILADPDAARADELTPRLVNAVINAKLGRHALGEVQIAGLTCYRSAVAAPAEDEGRLRAEDRIITWWLDASGTRQGETE